MGQKATYARIDAEGNVKATAVAWSEILDVDLCNEVGCLANDKRAAVVRDIFTAITDQFGLIYSLKLSDDGPFIGSVTPIKGTNFVIEDGYARDENSAIIAKVGSTPIKSDYAEIFNLELDTNSLGAIYDERIPDCLSYFWLDWDEGFHFITTPLSDMEPGACLGEFHDVKVSA